MLHAFPVLDEPMPGTRIHHYTQTGPGSGSPWEMPRPGEALIRYWIESPSPARWMTHPMEEPFFPFCFRKGIPLDRRTNHHTQRCCTRERWTHHRTWGSVPRDRWTHHRTWVSVPREQWTHHHTWVSDFRCDGYTTSPEGWRTGTPWGATRHRCSHLGAHSLEHRAAGTPPHRAVCN